MALEPREIVTPTTIRTGRALPLQQEEGQRGWFTGWPPPKRSPIQGTGMKMGHPWLGQTGTSWTDAVITGTKGFPVQLQCT